MIDPLTGAALVLSVGGTLFENASAAVAERKNAEFYRRQEEFNRIAGERQASIAKRNYAYLKGQQMGVAASQGVALAGSVSSIIAGTMVREIEELEAIKLQTELEVDMARLKREQASDKAGLYSSPFYNILTAGTTALKVLG